MELDFWRKGSGFASRTASGEPSRGHVFTSEASLKPVSQPALVHSLDLSRISHRISQVSLIIPLGHCSVLALLALRARKEPTCSPMQPSWPSWPSLPLRCFKSLLV